tara:strand:- start:967 stop:1677 length:711 start_codon:yes stop_codon:yes gene_type:complete
MVNKKGYIYSQQESLWGESECIGFGTDDFYIKQIDKKISNKIIIENHYSKKVAGFATTYVYLGVFEKNKLLGSLQYGFMMNPASAKNIVKGTGIYEYLELNRMWLDDKIKTKYPESQAISYSIKYIKKKFPKVKWIQSFADERCGGFGIVYQACSFDYFGDHNSEFYELDGVTYHKIAMSNLKDTRAAFTHLRKNKERAIKKSLRQFRYIKFIDKRVKKNCLLKQQPYPKHYERTN